MLQVVLAGVPKVAGKALVVLAGVPKVAGKAFLESPKEFSNSVTP